jgi:plastocyanin
MPKILLSAVVALALMGACGGAAGGPETSGSVAVEVVNISFAPADLEVEVGTDVTWTNEDESVHHTVTSGEPGDNGVPGVSESKPSQPDGTFDGDLADAGADFTFTFTEAGTYAYFCRVHPSMTARVVVR